MHVIGVDRTGDTDSPDSVDETGSSSAFIELVAEADAVVVTLRSPRKPRECSTQISSQQCAAAQCWSASAGAASWTNRRLRPRSLVDARLAGAALDVFANEPLESASPLWELPNVLLSPHTAALSVHENERIVELFTDNLRRYLTDEELIGLVHPRLMY